MKVLVIGNSHIASLMLASKSVGVSRPGWHFDFFGVPEAQPGWFVLGEDDQVNLALPETLRQQETKRKLQRIIQMNGADHASLSGYDVVLRYGMMPGQEIIKRVIAFFAIGGFPRRRAPNRMSGALYRDLCLSLAESDLPHQSWCRPLPCPVYDLAQPHRSRRILDGPREEKGAQYRHLRRHPEYASLCFAAYQEVVRARFGNGYGEVLLQPSHTVEPGLMTQRKYSKDAPRLTAKMRAQPKTDVSHMNAEYGKEVLEHLIDGVEGSRPDGRISS
jgi:hypothetical protein